jgi:hypothetical protein
MTAVLGEFLDSFCSIDILTTELIDSQGNIDYNRISLFLPLIMALLFMLEN